MPSHLRVAEDVRQAFGLHVHFVFPEEARRAFFLSDLKRAGWTTSFISRHDAPPQKVARLRAVLHEQSARIVHSQFTSFDLEAGLAGKSAGAKVVWHVLNSLLGYSPRQRAKDLVKVKLGAGLCDVVIANSYQTYEESLRRGFPRNKLRIVFNGLVLNRLGTVPGAREATRRELGLPADAFVLLSFPWNPVIKGADVLLRAVDAVERSRPSRPAMLVITGGRVLRDTVHRTLGGRWPPWLHLIKPFDDVARLYAAADMFVSASRADAFPMAVGEAMASGLPVISSDIPGPAPYFAAPGCFTFPSEDSQALASTICEVIDRADLHALGQANRAFVIQRFSVEQYAARTVDIYSHLLRGRDGAAPAEVIATTGDRSEGGGRES